MAITHSPYVIFQPICYAPVNTTQEAKFASRTVEDSTDYDVLSESSLQAVVLIRGRRASIHDERRINHH